MRKRKIIKNQNISKNERCDDESEVFNARINEDEMIITIQEYTKMKDYVNTFERKEKVFLDEKRQMLTEIESCRTEIKRLKLGIINFIKLLGG